MLDYDDLLLYWAHAMSDPKSPRIFGDRFDHVLVDEYQDTNRLQASILLALKPYRPRAYRGRRRRPVDLFISCGNGAQHSRLSSGNFIRRRRSSRSIAIIAQRKPILAAANAVIEQASERFTKNLWSDRVSGSVRSSSPCAMKPIRRATWSSAYWITAKEVWHSSSKPCCFERHTTAGRWRSSLSAAMFRL